MEYTTIPQCPAGRYRFAEAAAVPSARKPLSTTSYTFIKMPLFRTCNRLKCNKFTCAILCREVGFGLSVQLIEVPGDTRPIEIEHFRFFSSNRNVKCSGYFWIICLSGLLGMFIYVFYVVKIN